MHSKVFIRRWMRVQFRALFYIFHFLLLSQIQTHIKIPNFWNFISEIRNFLNSSRVSQTLTSTILEWARRYTQHPSSGCREIQEFGMKGIEVDMLLSFLGFWLIIQEISTSPHNFFSTIYKYPASARRTSIHLTSYVPIYLPPSSCISEEHPPTSPIQ